MRLAEHARDRAAAAEIISSPISTSVVRERRDILNGLFAPRTPGARQEVPPLPDPPSAPADNRQPKHRPSNARRLLLVCVK